MTAAHALAYVKRNAGITAAELAAAFDVPVFEAGSTLRVLRAAGKVRSRGRTKGTRYTAK